MPTAADPRITVRLDALKHGGLLAACEARGVSVNRLVRECLDRSGLEVLGELAVAEDGPRRPRRRKREAAPVGEGEAHAPRSGGPVHDPAGEAHVTRPVSPVSSSAVEAARQAAMRRVFGG